MFVTDVVGHILLSIVKRHVSSDYILLPTYVTRNWHKLFHKLRYFNYSKIRSLPHYLLVIAINTSQSVTVILR